MFVLIFYCLDKDKFKNYYKWWLQIRNISNWFFPLAIPLKLNTFRCYKLGKEIKLELDHVRYYPQTNCNSSIKCNALSNYATNLIFKILHELFLIL